MRIDWREDHRRGAQETILARAYRFGRNVLHLACSLVKAGNLPAVDDVWIQRIRRDVTIFFDPNRPPIAERDRSVIAATGSSRRSAFLLRAIDPVRKFVVG